MARSKSRRTSNTRAVAAVVGLTAALGLSTSNADTGSQSDPVRGIVRSLQQAMISTDLQARATKIGFKEGEHFRKGDVLVEFDCRKQHAALAAAEAQRLETTLALDNAEFLKKVQAAGKHETETARARVAKTTADAEGLRAQLDDCVLKAPFDGSVLQMGLQEHETPAGGKPFIGVVADGALEVDLIVSSAWLRWLKPGTEFKFSIDETQTQYAVAVERLGAAVDPISQTVKIAASFKDAPVNVLPGMSGTADFQVPGG
jgi:membrane fusion protein, multidrug efflux system